VEVDQEKENRSISIKFRPLTRISSKINQHILRKLTIRISSIHNILQPKVVNKLNKSELLKLLHKPKTYQFNRSKDQSTTPNNLISTRTILIKTIITSRFIMFHQRKISNQ